MRDDTVAISAIKEEVIRLARLSFECLNNRDYSFESPAGQEVLSHVALDFEAVLADVSPEPMGWHEAFGTLGSFQKADAEVQYVIRSMTADVSASRNSATVYAELEMAGASEGVSVHGISVAKWRKGKDGKWMCYQVHNMRNMCGNDGLF